MASGADGLFDDNISPSLYAKGQGKPVKIWGFLGHGRLEYYVLPLDHNPKKKMKTTHMNGDRYEGLIGAKFSAWRQACFGDHQPVHLIQDHETCLWQERNLAALRKAGCPVVEEFQKHSPDLNAIEGVWRLVRQRLQETEPVEFESRDAFLVRLRRTVHWLNDNRGDQLLHLCTNQKERAQEIHDLGGAKCKF
jgi:hypothetical protein